MMTLFLIGLGLGDEKDISVRGLETVTKADIVYLERYTSILSVRKERLEAFYGRSILLADRDLVEQHAKERLLTPAKEKDVCLLVVGDPFGATTHTDLMLRAERLGVPVKVIHNASIINAIGVVGLELYKYGRTTSIPFWEPGYEPTTPYDAIKENKARGLHTLCLLDIKVKEPTKDELLRQEGANRAGGTSRPPLPRFMSLRLALEQLRKMEEKSHQKVIIPETLVVGVARLGQQGQLIVAGTVAELLTANLGEPLHSLIVPGTLHVVEEEALRRWNV